MLNLFFFLKLELNFAAPYICVTPPPPPDAVIRSGCGGRED